MKVVISSSKELLLSLYILSIFIVGAQLFMAFRAFNYSTSNIESEAFYEKKYLAEGTYLINSVTQDSLKQWHINTYIQFEDNSTQVIDCFKPQFKNIPYVYATYYLILGLLWLMVFYHLYIYIQYIRKFKVFEESNLKHIYQSGRLLSILSLFYFLSIQGIDTLLHYGFDVRIHHSNAYNYGQIMWYSGLNLLYMIMRLYAKTTFSGMEIKSEQDLTI